MSSMISVAQTKIIAHRGYSNIAPENTLVAFKKAIEVGADYFELDVHKTKDGVLVVIHDKTVNRTSSNNKKGEISKFNYNELEDIHIGFSTKFGEQYSNEKIPTLEEALLLAKGDIKVCVEIKEENIEKQVTELLQKLDMINEVIVFSFSKQTVLNIEKINPNIETLFLISSANLETLDFVKENNINAIGVGRSTDTSKEFISYAHKNNIKVFKWTINNEEEIKELIDLKIDGIITNVPDLAIKLNQ
jgi:glycerophosphoryl diester phosphodiesterase